MKIKPFIFSAARLIAVLLFTSHPSAAQAQIPESFVNLGAGGGVNHGGFGVKTVVGSKNSGLLVGVGILPGGPMGYQVGGQVSVNWFYANAGYGRVGYYTVNGGTPQGIEAGCVLIGGMAGIGKERRGYFEAGIGHTFGAKEVRIGPLRTDHNGVVIDLGFGIRIG